MIHAIDFLTDTATWEKSDHLIYI